MIVDTRTHRGLLRPSNQDAVIAERLAGGAVLLAVADGVGGYPGGEVASALAVAALRESVTAEAGSPAERLRSGFRSANARIRERQRFEYEWMSTTMVAAIVEDGDAWLANVGDSRAYRLHARGLERLTRDHSWVEEQIAAGRLRPDDPAALANRAVITRSLGGEADPESDLYGPLPLLPGDALLLCSDGLHGLVPEQEIVAELREPWDDAADRLVRTALGRGGTDNVTVAIYVAQGD